MNLCVTAAYTPDSATTYRVHLRAGLPLLALRHLGTGAVNADLPAELLVLLRRTGHVGHHGHGHRCGGSADAHLHAWSTRRPCRAAGCLDVAASDLAGLFTDQLVDGSDPRSIGIQLFVSDHWIVTLELDGRRPGRRDPGRRRPADHLSKGAGWTDAEPDHDRAHPGAARGATLSYSVGDRHGAGRRHRRPSTRPVVVATGARARQLHRRPLRQPRRPDLLGLNLTQLTISRRRRGHREHRRCSPSATATYRYLLNGSFRARPGLRWSSTSTCLNTADARGPPAGWTDTQGFNVAGTTADAVRTDTAADGTRR